MSHKAKALLIHCIDFRFIKKIKEWMGSQNLLGVCDEVSLAGAVQNIVSPKNEADKELVLRQIDIAKRLHDIDEVILMNHTDCGAYGGANAFANELAEQEKHELDMREARAIILSKFPELKVRIILAKINREGGVEFAEV
ncbi:hypothetical protein HYT45_04430 [Candidatus Uhrbacteria bacterium]|nr:hypothetical protein [Candidatus Uhrbacteria bacterium]